MEEKWLTPREAAALIGVTDVSIRGWANAGLITYRILGKSMSVLKEDVLRVGKEKSRIIEATLSVDEYVAMLRQSKEELRIRSQNLKTDRMTSCRHSRANAILSHSRRI